jgi:branched-chain amino acid transport system substrate-binding protein
LSGPNAERGAALARAAGLALKGDGAPTLDVLDTKGTPEGAAAAADAAIAGGAGLILGPLTAGETAAVAGPARAAGVAVLPFTSDPAQAQTGVWPIGLMPAQQVRRMVAAVMAQGKNRFAAVLPDSDFGHALATALQQATSSAGAPEPIIGFHTGTTGSINSTIREISGYASRRGPVEAQIHAARALGTAEGRRQAARLARTPIPPPPFDAILLADSGERLSTVASLLPYYDLDPPTVRVLGPALWGSASARGDAALVSAWFAAPDPATRANFDALYQADGGGPAPGLSDFAYDAAGIARALARDGGFSFAALCRPDGFAGVDGVLALQPDGTVRRGLAMFELQRGGPVVVEPAPDTITAPGL